MIENTFYIGSCRYESTFRYGFPPRLHSTTEIIHFLENYHSLDFSDPKSYFIYGGCNHPGIVKESQDFLTTKTLHFCQQLCIEICTRKVAYDIDTGLPMNAFYLTSEFYRQYCPIHINYEIKIQTDEEIKNDISKIIEILRTKFNIFKIYILTPVNLKLKTTNTYIVERSSLSLLLKSIYPLTIDIGLILESIFPDAYLEDVLPDNIHYEQNSIYISKIFDYLIVRFGENVLKLN